MLVSGQIHGGITPACAGNTVFLLELPCSARDHPRLRGEYQLEHGCEIALQGSPPPARGIQPRWRFTKCSTGITPACAGNTFHCVAFTSACWDHPRLRGEYLLDKVQFIPVTGSPPPARGIHILITHSPFPSGITPACAGNTGCCSCSHRSERDHPRLRGEYSNCSAERLCGKGSPPPARGIH